jgi:hypothetical protein
VLAVADKGFNSDKAAGFVIRVMIKNLKAVFRINPGYDNESQTQTFKQELVNGVAVLTLAEQKYSPVRLLLNTYELVPYFRQPAV